MIGCLSADIVDVGQVSAGVWFLQA